MSGIDRSRASTANVDVHVGTASVVQSAWLVELGPIRLANVRYVSREDRFATGHALMWWVTGCLIVGGVSSAAFLLTLSLQGGHMRRSTVVQSIPSVASTPIKQHRRGLSSRPKISRKAAPPIAGPTASDATPIGEVQPMSRYAASDMAWRSGDPQDWAEGRDHGLVVAGPLEIEDGRKCRAFSTFTRQPDGENSVEQSRRCEQL